MIALLLAFDDEECTDFINQKPGAWIYNMSLSTDPRVYCWNTSYTPSYLIFNTYSEETVLTQYKWKYYNSDDYQKSEAEVRFLDNMIAYPEEYAQIHLSQPEDTPLIFTIANLPRICTDGIYFSSIGNEQMEFKTDATGFFKVGPNSDKCLVFSSYSEQEFTIFMNSTNYEDQMFMYESYDTFESVQHNVNMTYHCNMLDTNHTCMIRIILSDDPGVNLIHIDKKADSEGATYPHSEIIMKKDIKIACPPSNAWYTETVMIVLIILCIFFVSTTVMLCANRCVLPPVVPERSMRDLTMNLTNTNELGLGPQLNLAFSQ